MPNSQLLSVVAVTSLLSESVIFRLPLILTFSNVAPSAIVFATKFISTSLVLSPIPLATVKFAVKFSNVTFLIAAVAVIFPNTDAFSRCPTEDFTTKFFKVCPSAVPQIVPDKFLIFAISLPLPSMSCLI